MQQPGRTMGWLEAGDATVFPHSVQESRVGSSVFAPDTTKELDGSGMINKKMHKTRAASTCHAGTCSVSKKGTNSLGEKLSGSEKP